MEPVPPRIVEHAALHPVDEAGHGDAFYALTNPRYFGLPLGVLIATAVSALAVGITLMKFVGASLRIWP